MGLHLRILCAGLFGILLAAPFPVEAQDAAAAAKIRRANELMQAGRPEEAIPLYRELEAEFPGVPSFGINVAIAQYKTGRYPDAIRQCNAVLKLRPDLFSAWLFLGASYAALGEHSNAVEPLRKAVDLAPEDRNARVMLADALFADGQYASAAGQFEEAAHRMPESPRVWRGLGRSYAAFASELLGQVERVAPESAEAAALAGDMEADREQWALAFSQYRRALALRPSFRGLHTAIASIYEKTGHPDWAATERAQEPVEPPRCEAEPLECEFAKEKLREVVSASGDAPAVLYWRARAARALAQQAWKKLDELPPSPERFENAALAHEKSGQYREAAASWKEALQLAPGNHEFERQLALALCRSNDCGSALPLIKNLLDRAPSSAELNYLYGTALASAGSAGQATPFLEAAVKLDGRIPAARGALGQAYLEAGLPERAIPELEASLAEDTDGSRRYQLARAYQAAGKQAQAAETLRAYREILAKHEAEEKNQPRITPP